MPAAEQSPASRNVVAARRSGLAVSSKNVPTVLKRPKEACQAQQPSYKKSKKPKPTLQNMSLGDVMLPRAPVVSAKNKREPARSTPQTESNQEFPALGASVLNAKLPAHASWGKKPVKPAASPSEIRQVAPPAKASTKQAPKPTIVATTSKQPGSKKATDFQSFGAKPRTHGGEEHDLIRLLQEGKFHSQKKGRHRITPRKKKFTTLKKKVLQERLEAWRKLHPEDAPADQGSGTAKSTCTLCLENFAESDELEDDDEYKEIVENLQDMATKVGTIRDAFVLRQSSGSCPAFVWFQTSQSAAAACACWKGLVIGGQGLDPVLIHPNLEESKESVMNEMWRQAVISVHSGEKNQAMDICSPNTSAASVVLRNVLTNDDFEDKDSLEESLSDVRSLVQQHGSVSDFQAKQDDTGVIIIVTYDGGTDVAMNAVTKLNGLVVGGMTVSANLTDETVGDTKTFVVQLTNALTEDDFEDEDCLQESLDDIESLSKQFGSVARIRASREEGGIVLITYTGDQAVANNAAEKLDGTVLGGKTLSASVLSPSDDEKPSSEDTRYLVLLRNILSEDDLADEECLQESLEDVKEIASQYGKVSNMAVDVDDPSGTVKVEYDGGEGVAKSAAEKFNGMVIGGQTVVATIISHGDDKRGENEVVPSAAAEEAAKPLAPSSTPPEEKPLYSGDKLISERFAECKRVPKLVPSTDPRNYASVSGDEEVKSLLIEMLGELMRLQHRAIEDKNAKARRRIVMGLREVARGIRSHKVKMIVMANNLDQYGAIDEKLQDILDLAREKDVPVIFELNKRRLGKAVGKAIKVSVVGIQNADGAHQQFKKLVSLAAKNT
jgi:selenocysteine insertion sequence-binding protein 2